MRVVMGHSDDIDTADAIRIVITQCQKKLRGDCPKAGIFLTSIRETDYTPLLEAVLNAFPGIILVGCTTDGEVTSLYDFLDDSVALLLFCGDELRFGAGIGRNLSENYSQAALTAYNQARQALGSAGRLCLAFPDGLSCIDLPINTLLQNIFATGFPVFGGTAGDQFVFNKTYQFFGREVYSDALPLLLIDGEFHYSWGNLSGWLPIGQRYEIVSASNVVWRIGDKTALDFYRHFLGENTNQYTQFPLAVFEKQDGQISDTFYLRDPFMSNQQNGSMPFFGTFPPECIVQLTEVGRNDLLCAATQSCNTALEHYPGTIPDIFLIFSCATRRRILGSNTCQECHTLRRLPQNIPFFGFYTYGELGPLEINGPLHYHNDSYIVLALGTQ